MIGAGRALRPTLLRRAAFGDCAPRPPRRGPAPVLARAALSAAALAAAAAGCGPAAEPLDPEGPRGAILVILDTVRADHLSAYGYARPTSPNLERLASSGVLFEQAISCAPWTKPGIEAILAGTYPVEGFAEDSPLDSSLVEAIRGRGYATAAFTEGGWFTGSTEMDRGFETFVEERGAIVHKVEDGELSDPAERGIAHTFARATEWLREHAREHFFLVIHTYEPHAPYTNRDFASDLDPGQVGRWFTIPLLEQLHSGELRLSEAERAYVAALYDGDLLNSDRHLGALLDELDRLGLAERTVVAVTSDHGEDLGDLHPEFTGDHGHSLRDPLLRVPLVVRDPTRPFPPGRVAAQVRTIDVLPTLAELLDASLPEGIEGRSLVPLMEGAEEPELAAIAGWVRKGPDRAAVRAGGFKYIETLGPGAHTGPMLDPPPERQLYDLRSDPAERANLFDADPERARTLAESLAGWAAILRPASEGGALADQELQERLRSLGY